MDIKDLNKSQLILLVILVSFVISIGTSVSVVSLMQQEPTTVTQTINKVIQNTIEKVTVPVEVPVKEDKNNTKKASIITSDIKPLVDLYSIPINKIENTDEINTDLEKRKKIGQVVVISDTGLVFVDAPIVTEGHTYQVVLDKNYFNLEKVSKVGSVYIMQVVSKADVYTEIGSTENANIDTQ